MKNTKYYYEFENLLIKYFDESGFSVFQHYRPDKRKDTGVDIYISSPIRAFVEIKYSPRLNKDLINHISKIQDTFAGFILPILIFGFDDDILRTSTLSKKKHNWVYVTAEGGFRFPDFSKYKDDLLIEPFHKKSIKVKSDRDFTAKTCVDSIIEKIQSGKYPTTKTNKIKYDIKKYDKDFKSATAFIPEVISSFQSVIPKKYYEVLNNEVKWIKKEFDSGHYSSVAVRCGVAIEIILFSLATAWGVDANKETAKNIKHMKDTLTNIEKHYVEIATIEPDSEKYNNSLRKLKQAIENHTKVLNNLLMSIVLEDIELSDNKIPINTDALLRDILKKYSSNKEVTIELKKLHDDYTIGKLMKIRNQAAHASFGGSSKEISRKQVELQKEYFESILFTLSNVASILSHNK